MSTNSLMNVGVQAMSAAQIQLSTTGHNIANAAVPGYSRQTVKLATVQGRNSGSGYIGGGVMVQSVERAVNQFLTGRVNQTQSQSSADEVRHQMLSQLDASFGLGEEGLGQAAAQVFASFGDLAASPKDEAVRSVVLSGAETLASRFRSTSEQIEQLQDSTVQQVEDHVTAINGLAGKIASLNRELSGTGSLTNKPNDLLDQRDQLISELSQHILVTRVDNLGTDGQPDGTVNLFVGGGQSLVLGSGSEDLVAVADDQDSNRVRVMTVQNGHQRELSAGLLGEGALAGLMKFQNEDLRDTRAALGQMAAALADGINQQHTQGTDLNGQAGGALLSAGNAQVWPSTANARDASGAYASTVSVTRVAGQGAQLQASDYELQLDPADSTGTRYQVTRQSDGTVFSGLASGATVDGFKFDVTGTSMNAQDRFLLQPVSAAAGQLDVSITDPRKLAAAGATAAGSGNTNALAMRELAKSALVESKTFSNAHAKLIGDVGVRVQRAGSDADASATVLSTVKEQLGSETGVNLEEEAAKMLQFQQSYQAAAKVLVTAQKMFDTMLSVMN